MDLRTSGVKKAIVTTGYRPSANGERRIEKIFIDISKCTRIALRYYLTSS
jgi:hypothetical protein